MAFFQERYSAAMVLSGVGDSLGYRNGQWFECTSGKQIYEELMELSLDEINIKLPGWKTSACLEMHKCTAVSLATHAYKLTNKELFKHIAMRYKNAAEYIDGIHSDETLLKSCKVLGTVDAVDGYIVPFDADGCSNAAAARSMCIGLMHHNPDDLDRLLAISLECGRMTHHHPIGYLGGLTTALFTSFAIQHKPIEQWGCALVKTLPMALDYIKRIGIAVKENEYLFGHFTEAWKNHLQLRHIASSELQTFHYERYDFEEKDEYYRSISLDGVQGSSGLDAPLIAYDAILSCNGNWLDLCVGAICHGGHSNVTGCIAACWYGALYGYEGVSECNYANVEFMSTSKAYGEHLLRLSYPHYSIYIDTLKEKESVQAITIYERVPLKRNNGTDRDNSSFRDGDIDITEVIRRQVSDLQSNVESEDGGKIGKAISVHVHRFIDEIGRVFPVFRSSEILKVGSFYEGTKIKCADEFDFIVVLEEFSKPGSIVINRQEGSVESIYINHERLQDHPIFPEESSYSKDTSSNQATEICNSFASALYQVVMNKGQPSQIRPKYVTLDEDEMVEQPQIDGIEMKVRMYRAQHPNIILEFVHQNMPIHVDLTLALRYFNTTNSLNTETIPVHNLINMIHEQNSILFVVYEEMFRITLTEVEVKYIKEKMLQKHKIIYMFLKYINGLYTEDQFLEQAGYQPFSSYMLKTICLHHVHSCKTADHKSYDSCLSAILNIMGESIVNGYLVPADSVNEICVGYLPSVFDIKRNLYYQPRKTVDILVELRKCMVQDLKSVLEHGLKWQNLEEFNREIKLHVEKSIQSVCSKTWSDSTYILPLYRKPPA